MFFELTPVFSEQWAEFFEHLAGFSEQFLTDNVSAGAVNTATGGFFELSPDCFESQAVCSERTVEFAEQEAGFSELTPVFPEPSAVFFERFPVQSELIAGLSAPTAAII